MARRRLRLIVGVLIATVFGLVVGALLLAWSGLYNIAASRGHWAIIEWFLAFGMRNSVELRASFVDVPALDRRDLYVLGAGHFHSGCAYCHGAPGMPISPIAQHMLPPPPDLSNASKQWKDRELFWIVKHGIKYTGMPAWASQQRDDEVWAVVAFLKRLPSLDEKGYRELALGDLTVEQQSGREIATADATSAAVTACARCHGADRRGPTSNLVPVLHGQSRQFLANALQAFASGRRASGIMQPAAAELTTEAARRVAEFYSKLTPPLPATRRAAVDASSLERGRIIANNGIPSDRIPACITCHGGDAIPEYPRLAGQNFAYMIGRLRRWRHGVTSDTATDAIMAPIARRLNEQQSMDAAAYFSTVPATSTAGETGQ